MFKKLFILENLFVPHHQEKENRTLKHLLKT